jgi:hypothetical protein
VSSPRPARVGSAPPSAARGPDEAADGAFAVALSLPPTLVAVLKQHVREAVSEALDAQTRPPRLLSDERLCAEVLGCSVQTLRTRLLPEGIPFVRVGDVRRWDPEAVLVWLRSRSPARGES